MGVALMFYLMFGSGYGEAVSQSNKEMREDAQALSGKDSQGRLVTETLTFQPAEKNGKIYGIQVLTVEPGEAMDQRYGIKPGDIIVGDTQTPFDLMVNNAQDSKSFIHTAYQYNRPLEVQRNGVKISLPEQRSASAPIDPTAPPAANTAPQQPAKKSSPLDAARGLRDKIETH
jgi:hypothetical protein